MNRGRTPKQVRANKACSNTITRFNKFPREPELSEDEVRDTLLSIDPKGGLHCSWVVREYYNGEFLLEDAEFVKQDMQEYFDNLKALRRKNKAYGNLKTILGG